MPNNALLADIFQRGSKTYYNSTNFFDAKTKEDVTALYAFVRVADDYIDMIPQNTRDFYSMWKEYKTAAVRGMSQDPVIDAFVQLSKRKKFNPEWIQAFFESMEMDIHKKRYATITETEKYMHGSAEVVGLMMAKILNITEKSYEYAMDLGKAMQYINFIRDINEDVYRARIYFPEKDLKTYKLENLERSSAFNDLPQFQLFIRKQIDRYFSWQESAEKGYAYIPKKYLVPIKTAADMYKWTAQQIYNRPEVVYEKKVKPTRARIYAQGLKNIMLT